MGPYSKTIFKTPTRHHTANVSRRRESSPFSAIRYMSLSTAADTFANLHYQYYLPRAFIELPELAAMKSWQPGEKACMHAPLGESASCAPCFPIVIFDSNASTVIMLVIEPKYISLWELLLQGPMLCLEETCFQYIHTFQYFLMIVHCAMYRGF